MDSFREHLHDVLHALVSPQVLLTLVGFEPEAALTQFRDCCLGAGLGVVTLIVTLSGPQAAVKHAIHGMVSPYSDFPILVWIFWPVAVLLLPLAIQLLSVSLFRSMNSRVPFIDLDKVATLRGLKIVIGFISLSLNVGVLQAGLQESTNESIYKDEPPDSLHYIQVLTTLLTVTALCSMIWFGRKVWTSGDLWMSSDAARDAESLPSVQSNTCNDRLEDSYEVQWSSVDARQSMSHAFRCCGCCCIFTLVLVLVAIISWFASAPNHGGVINPGNPIAEEQWEVMNHRDLVFCEMSMRMASANAYGKWGDNRHPGGITDPQAFHYRPEGAPEPYPNTYLANIQQVTIIGSDNYTFPRERPLSPRWTVLRIKHLPGHGGDDLVIVFRGSSGDPQTAMDWTVFDALNEPSAVRQEDGMRFTRGFFDESLCVMLRNGLFDVLKSEKAAGVATVFAIGHSLGGAWASILMTMLAPDRTTECPYDFKYASPFGALSAKAVTFGKAAPFYVEDSAAPPEVMGNLAARETDYVYHADTIARGDHGLAKYCYGPCWHVLPLTFQPFFKFGHTSYLRNHRHGDTTTIWIVNDVSGEYAPSSFSKFPVATKDQIGVYSKEKDRWDGINVGFIVGRLPPNVLMAAGNEHGVGYTYSMWKYLPQHAF